MKDELKRVLNNKLGDINNDIESLNSLNIKIEEEREKSSFITGILDLFKGGSGNNLLNFAEISKEDFDRVVDILGEEVRDTFNSESCNYDGLVYLINGINSGVSLTLTDDQKNGIEKFIAKLGEKSNEFDSAIDGYALVKSRYEISDLDVLDKKKNEYEELLTDIDSDKYVKNTELLNEAIKYSSLSSQDTVNLLMYVLEYNAEVFNNYKPEVEEKVKEKKKEKPVEEKVEVKEEPKEEIVEEVKEEPIEEKEEEKPIVEEKVEEKPIEEEKTEEEDDFHFNQISNDLFELPNISFDEPEEKVEAPAEVQVSEEKAPETDYQEFTPQVEPEVPNNVDYVPAVEEEVKDNVSVEVPTVEEVKEETKAPEVVVENPVEVPTEAPAEVPVEVPTVEEVKAEPVEEPANVIDEDFRDIVDSKADYEETVTKEDEKTSTRELQKIFSKYGVEENIVLNELIDGNVNEYQKTLDTLKNNDILDYFRPSKELLVETLLYSNSDVIENVLNIVKKDLSVDDEDYGITLKIVINTIPSIFVKDGGNYDNFVKNVELFKQLGLNLINLFDFSKEVFIADNENVVKNVEIIRKYGFEITYKNAKYFFLIPYIADKLDYYIESVYDDKVKNEKFDGINYIKDYAAKLNVVNDITIKRLRYSSENGKKVFGTKPGSLTGEITNLKVNALDISDDYMKKFFNNEFATLTGEEVREYTKLIHNSSNVGDYSDELDKLNAYRNGLRYIIEGVNVSYNKVVRNYSILRSYGIDTKKALQFAVCYNLVITKDEYDKLNNLLETIGGNV